MENQNSQPASGGNAVIDSNPIQQVDPNSSQQAEQQFQAQPQQPQQYQQNQPYQQFPQYQQPTIIIQNTNTNTNTNTIPMGALKKEKNKWVALLLCFFIGFLGAHKFYEGKAGMGILYILTAGLFLIGVVLDFIALLFKPNPYYI